MDLNSFKTAMFLANLLYNTNFTNPSDFEEIGLIAYRMIGNRKVRYYHYGSPVDPETLSIELPCNCDIIESVTIPMEDWKYTDGAYPDGNINSAFIEQYIEVRKPYHDPLYLNGKYVHYEQVGNKLYFQFPFPMVLVIYEGEMLDDEGLPQLNDREVQALAVFAAYTMKLKEALATNNANIMLFANQLKQEWNKACDLARIEEHLDQNIMNDILDAKSSWNRKSYGISYKPAIK